MFEASRLPGLTRVRKIIGRVADKRLFRGYVSQSNRGSDNRVEVGRRVSIEDGVRRKSAWEHSWESGITSMFLLCDYYTRRTLVWQTMLRVWCVSCTESLRDKGVKRSKFQIVRENDV